MEWNSLVLIPNVREIEWLFVAVAPFVANRIVLRCNCAKNEKKKYSTLPNSIYKIIIVCAARKNHKKYSNYGFHWKWKLSLLLFCWAEIGKGNRSNHINSVARHHRQSRQWWVDLRTMPAQNTYSTNKRKWLSFENRVLLFVGAGWTEVCR